MPFINKIELETLESRVEKAEGLNDRLQLQMGGIAFANTTAELIAKVLDDEQAKGTPRADAERIAHFTVEQIEREKLLKRISQEVIDEAGESISELYRVTNAASIRRQLVDQYTTDGTFDEIRRQTEEDVRNSARQDVLNSSRQQFAQELADDESMERLRAEIMRGLHESGELDKLSSDMEQKAKQDLEQAVKAEMKQEISRKIVEGEATVKAEIRARIEASKQLDNYKRVEEDKARKQLEKVTLDEMLAEIPAEVRQKILSAKADLELTKIETGIDVANHERLKKEFQRNGIDIMTLKNGTELVLYFGDLGKITYRQGSEISYYGQLRIDWRELSAEKGITSPRTVKLIALGDGRFKVSRDSLEKSKSAYEKASALRKGIILTIGEMQADNGKKNFVHVISQGSDLFYDTDSTDEEVASFVQPVQNIQIDGLRILELYTEGEKVSPEKDPSDNV